MYKVQGDKILKNLFTYSLTHLLTSKKAAFTLAEVLITLAIIGVVAAMTIPTLISDYQEKVTVNKVKTFYSLMSQAVAMSTVYNGQPESWSFSDVNGFANYLKPYLKIAKDCGTESGCITSDVYKRLNGQNWYSYDSSRFYKMFLTNGMSMWFRIKDDPDNNDAQDTLALFWLDVNGKLEPNQIGLDTFHFLLKNKGLIPASSDDCYTNDIGFSCTKFILENGNMDYPTKIIEEEE